MFRRFGTLVGLLLVTACHGTPEPLAAGDARDRAGARPPLPLETLRFYEAGVAYFERAGATSAGTALALVVPEPHLDDALRTLVILSGTSTRSPNLEFESISPHELTRDRAALPKNDALGYEEILRSLRTAEVEFVLASERVTGRLVEVKEAPVVVLASSVVRGEEIDPDTVDDLYLTIAGVDGGVRRLRASAVKRIRALDPERRERLDRALADESRQPVPNQRSLYAKVSGGPLRIGYVAETPVWVTSYRLLLPASGKDAKLQGSALVHNDTDEAWSGVRATFTSARPESFETNSASPSHKWLRPGSGGPRTRDESPSAAGSFAYPAPAPISVRARGSALVPFVEATFDVVPVVRRGLSLLALGKRAVRARNTTSQTLPEGIAAVYSARGFEGEAVVPRLLPGASALLEFADEQDVELELTSSVSNTRVTSVGFSHSALLTSTSQRHERVYRVTNRRAESVRVEFPVGFSGPLQGRGFDELSPEPIPIGVFEVAGNQTATRAVTLERDSKNSATGVESVTAEQLRDLAGEPALSARVRATLRAAVPLADRVEAHALVAQKAGEREDELETAASAASSELTEMAKGGAALTASLVTRLVSLERDHERSRERVAVLEKEAARLVQVLTRELERLPKE